MTHEKKKVFYITTAIDYPNGNPHIGHAFEKIIADVYARWFRNNAYDTFYLTGTDENSQKIVEAAEQAGKKTEDFLNETVQVFKNFCKKINISNDYFVRTTEERHKKATQLIYQKIKQNGDIYKGVYKGQYCTPCESFWTQAQLLNGNCPQCNRETHEAEEEAYFFQMSKYQSQLISHIQKDLNCIVPQSRRNEILSRLKEPLRDLCISRSSLKWGIPVPEDEKHVFYVWFDAVINYLPPIQYPDEQYKHYWQEVIHVIGKDIIWFHCVIWQCMLLACGIEPSKQIYVHGFINDKNGEKMSKSKGNVVDPFAMIEKYGVDAFRYYLLRTVGQGDDGKFDEDELVERYNNELANDLGNLLKRIQMLLKKIGGGVQREHAHDEIQMITCHEQIHNLMEQREHHKALDEVWHAIKKINVYLNDQEPWKVEDEVRKKEIIYNACEALRIATHYLAAFLPGTAQRIAKQLHFTLRSANMLQFGDGSFHVQHEEVLFPKIEALKEKQEEMQKDTAKHTFPLNLKVAKITDVKIHPDADKLYIIQLDVGNEKRQICSGLRPFYKSEELIDRNIILLSNLKKAKFKGVESHGMLLAAGETARLLSAPDSSPGEQVFLDGYANKAGQIRYHDFEKLELLTKNKNVEVFGKFLKTQHELVSVDVGDGVRVR